MPCIDNVDNFPCIYQIHPYWCIPAAVENVVKYHGGNLTQREIVDFVVQKYPFGSISFAVVKEVLEENYGERFSYEDNHHNNRSDLLNFIRDRIAESLPVIISMRLLAQNNTQITHMYTVLCIDGNFVDIFDTGWQNSGRLRKLRRDILTRLSLGLNTFTIRPK